MPLLFTSLISSTVPAPVINSYVAPAGTYENAYAETVAGNIIFTGPASDTVLSNYASARKVLIARAVWNNKSAVWDSEAVTYLASDATGISAEWVSPLTDGEQVTWRSLVALLIIPSFTDVAETISRVLGGELNAQDGLALDSDARFNMEVEKVISDLGLTETTFFGANPAKFNPTAEAPLTDAVRWPDACLDIPELLAIMQLPSTSISTVDATSRSLTLENTNLFVNGIGTGGAGLSWAGHVGGKTGTNGTSDRAFLFRHDMPDGTPVRFGFTGSGSEFFRFHDSVSMLFSAVDNSPGFMAPQTDSLIGDVPLIVGNVADSVGVTFPDKTATSANPPAVVARPSRAYTHSFDFDGADDFLSFGDDPDLNLGSQDFTLEVWFRGKGSAPAGIVNFLSKYYTEAKGRSYQLRYNNGQIQAWVADQASGGSFATGPADFGIVSAGWLFNGARRHICMQRTGAEIAVFVNGAKGGDTINIGAQALYTTANHLFVGCRGRTGPEDQYGSFILDELRMTVGQSRYNQSGFTVPVQPCSRS